MEAMLSKVEDTIGKHGDIIAAAAFILGVDQKDITSNGGLTTYLPLGGGLIAIKDLISHFGIAGITLPGNSPTTNRWAPNIGAFFNKALALYIGIKIAKEIFPNKYTHGADKIASKPLLAYAAGRIFDDPITASAASLTTPGQNAYPVANYTTAARNGLPVGMNAPWTT